MIRIIFSFIIILVMVVLVIANKNTTVQIDYIFGVTPPLKLLFVMAGSFIAGCLVFAIITVPGIIKNRLEIRKLKRSIQDMETTRSQTVQETEGPKE